MTAPAPTTLLNTDNADHLDFTGDHIVLGILGNKVFRQADTLNTTLRQLPDVEQEARDAVPGLAAAIAALDAVRLATKPDDEPDDEPDDMPEDDAEEEAEEAEQEAEEAEEEAEEAEEDDKPKAVTAT